MNEISSAYDNYVSAMNELGIYPSNDVTATANFVQTIDNNDLAISSGLVTTTDSCLMSSNNVTISNTSCGNGQTITIPSISSGTLNGSGTITTTPYTIPNIGTSTGVTYTYSTPYNSTEESDPDLELLEDLKEEFEGKLEEAIKSADELVEQMKEHPEGMTVFNNAFQFFTGQKIAFTEIIKKLKAYIKDYSENTDNE